VRVPAGLSAVHLDVRVLVGLDPRRVLHLLLADHGTGFHPRVDLVAGAVEETGVDEHDAVPGRPQTLAEVERGAPLLVHDAHLEVRRQLEASSTRVKSASAHATSSGPCIFGFTT